MIKIKIRIIITKVQLNVYIKLSVRAGGGCRFRLIHPDNGGIKGNRKENPGEVGKKQQACPF